MHQCNASLLKTVYIYIYIYIYICVCVCVCEINLIIISETVCTGKAALVQLLKTITLNSYSPLYISHLSAAKWFCLQMLCACWSQSIFILYIVCDVSCLLMRLLTWSTSTKLQFSRKTISGVVTSLSTYNNMLYLSVRWIAQLKKKICLCINNCINHSCNG